MENRADLLGHEKARWQTMTLIFLPDETPTPTGIIIFAIGLDGEDVYVHVSSEVLRERCRVEIMHKAAVKYDRELWEEDGSVVITAQDFP